MNPSIELRLESIARALTTVIIPAIDQSNSMALEQAQLACAHLAIIGAEIANAPSFNMLELAATRTLAETLLNAGSPPIEHPVIEALRLASTHEPVSPASLETEINRINEIIVTYLDLLAVSAQPAEQNAACSLVAAHYATHSMNSRKWFARLGFEARPELLPDLDAALSVVRIST